MVPNHSRRRVVLLLLVRLGIFALIIYGALQFFLFRSAVEKPLAYAGTDPAGRTRMTMQFPGKERLLSLGSVTLFKFSKTITPIGRSTIWTHDGTQFHPWRSIRPTFQLLTNRIEILLPKPERHPELPWMVRSRANIRYKIQLGPAKFEIARPIRFISATVSTQQTQSQESQ